MFNNVILIGRLVDKPSLKSLEDGTKVCNITLAVLRPFKNMAGDYETDFIPISLWYVHAQNTYQYCDKGDTICVKGRIAQRKQEINGKNYHFLEMIGERVIFLNTKVKYDQSLKQDDEQLVDSNA